jgi:hypothetical protein
MKMYKRGALVQKQSTKRAALPILAFVLFFLATTSLGRVIISARTTAPTGWKLRGPASATASVTFLLALKQRNVNVLDETSTAVSNPKSPLYRSFWSRAQIQDLVSPPVETIERVMKSLHDVGIVELNNLGDAIDGTFIFPLLTFLLLLVY